MIDLRPFDSSSTILCSCSPSILNLYVTAYCRIPGCWSRPPQSPYWGSAPGYLASQHVTVAFYHWVFEKASICRQVACCRRCWIVADLQNRARWWPVDYYFGMFHSGYLQEKMPCQLRCFPSNWRSYSNMDYRDVRTASARGSLADWHGFLDSAYHWMSRYFQTSGAAHLHFRQLS